jgi:division protein CdvB (Snf7/Vps24/ESCRT-III family)
MTYTYSDLEVARYIEREAAKIYDIVHVLKDEDENLSRIAPSTTLSLVWNDLVSLRCDLEEIVYERAGKI